MPRFPDSGAGLTLSLQALGTGLSYLQGLSFQMHSLGAEGLSGRLLTTLP